MTSHTNATSGGTGRSIVKILGGGREVGRSCVFLRVQDKSILLDCGLHPGKRNLARLPQLDFLRENPPDAVVITHYHIDHIGGLPYLSTATGFDGPVYMTKPTKDLGLLVISDFLRLNGSEVPFSEEDMTRCLNAATIVETERTIQVSAGLDLRFLYAGHALGAVMVQVIAHGYVVLYTGDITTFPERLIDTLCVSGAAPQPDLLIMESTYAGSIREYSRRTNERLLLKEVSNTLEAGGKVLIPAFAVGRTLEIVAILISYSRRCNLSFPIHVSSPLARAAMKAMLEQDSSWFADGVREHVLHDLVELQERIPLSQRSRVDDNEYQMVLIAAPAMLNAGFSREVFQKWRSDERNLVALPGFGYSDGSKGTESGYRCQIRNYSLSAHADAMGLFQLVRKLRPKKVVLVHGEDRPIESLEKLLKSDLGIGVKSPRTGEKVSLSRFENHVRCPHSLWELNHNRKESSELAERALLAFQKGNGCLRRQGEFWRCETKFRSWEFARKAIISGLLRIKKSGHMFGINESAITEAVAKFEEDSSRSGSIRSVIFKGVGDGRRVVFLCSQTDVSLARSLINEIVSVDR
ncbi:hypothetical protein NDN08_005055 [Rhodosorus marinus]|uniref:Integrator complex subunit 11 n=1 Tax=Rhodosorus marinus TaxID=101924 RepID=A0AAV8V0F3_9RHOD|nr:hypothetical protein NDN08_005055 [Rhodosorus marinus]